MSDDISIKQLLTQTKIQLSQCSDTPRLDAEWLLAAVLKQPVAFLITHPDYRLTEEQFKQFQNYIIRRMAGEPIAYILNRQGFWGLDLIVTQDTLIPRPETELLVELALAKLPDTESLAIADLGTGSGAIALALAHERPNWQIYAVDISAAALAIAKQNAMQLHLNNITFVQGNWLSAFFKQQRFSAIISNPPYIAEEDPHLQTAVLNSEPKLALIAEQQGLAAINTIAKEAAAYLLSGGWLLLEHGFQQGPAVMEILRQNGFSNIEQYLDLAGHGRAVVGQSLNVA